jgi:hypothetical protein
MGGQGYRRFVAAVAFVSAGSADAQALLSRVSLTAPAGYSEVAGSEDTREWAPARADADAATRIVLLDRPRESWDDAAGALKRLHRLLNDNCPKTKLETLPRPPPAHADGAVRGIMFCPTHDASGRGLVVVEDVIVVGDRMLIAKLAFDFPPFSPGVRPLARGQRTAALAVLDSIVLTPSAPRVLPP